MKKRYRKNYFLKLIITVVLVGTICEFAYRYLEKTEVPSLVESNLQIPTLNLVEEYKQQIKNQVAQYKQPVNDEGIAVNMLDNPYFQKKMPGFEYPKPQEISYHSTVTDTDRHAYVILPVNYSEDKEYPVLYLLHGLHGSHRTWLNKGADIILYNLYYFYDAREMIVVLPNNNVNQREDDEGLSLGELVADFDKIETDLIECLMPYINENYSTATGRENTAIAGNSMGGRETMNLAFNHQDVFGYVGVFSSSYVLEQPGYWGTLKPLLSDLTIDPKQGDFKLLMLAVGKSDNVCGQWTYMFHRRMNENGIKHIFYDTEGGHQNKVWQNALYNFGTRIFK